MRHLDGEHHPSWIWTVQVEHLNWGEKEHRALVFRESSEAVEVSAIQNTESWWAFLFVKRWELFPLVILDVVYFASLGQLAFMVTSSNVDLVLVNIDGSSMGWARSEHWLFVLWYNLSILDTEWSHITKSSSWVSILGASDKKGGLVRSLNDLAQEKVLGLSDLDPSSVWNQFKKELTFVFVSRFELMFKSDLGLILLNSISLHDVCDNHTIIALLVLQGGSRFLAWTIDNLLLLRSLWRCHLRWSSWHLLHWLLVDWGEAGLGVLGWGWKSFLRATWVDHLVLFSKGVVGLGIIWVDLLGVSLLLSLLSYWGDVCVLDAWVQLWNIPNHWWVDVGVHLGCHADVIWLSWGFK